MDPEKMISNVHALFCSYQSISEYELVNRIKEMIPEFHSTNKKYFDSSDGSESVEVEFFPY